MVVGRRKVDLEVAGMDHDADWRLDGQRNAIHQRVRYADGLDGEGPEVKLALRFDLDQLGIVQEPVLFQLALDIGQRELRGVDRHIELAQDPGQAADVVLMPMGEDDPADAGSDSQ